MRAAYFKHRKLFDFDSEFDIGRVAFWKQEVEDNHFLYRIEQLTKDCWLLLYHYHLAYFLSLYNDATEIEFFKHVCKILDNAIYGLKQKDRFDSNHADFFRRQILYEDFLQVIISTDPEGIEKAKDEVIATQKLEILELKKLISDLEGQIKELRKNQSKDYLNIAPGYLQTVVDLIYQLQDLTVEDRELIFSQTQIIWSKIITEYFKVDHKDINGETIRKYFPAERTRKIAAKNRLFKISRVKETSKEWQNRTSSKVSRL